MFDKEFYPTPESVLDLMAIDAAGKGFKLPEKYKK